MGGLSETEIASCLDAFLKFDQDGSGTIDKWELERVLNGMFSCEFA
jgi:Ca2+-binding EF-hand superfamily protein